MKQIIDHLRKNWIKYGFETVAIVVGILGAFALSNWSENQKLRDREVIYLNNLKGDLERQLITIDLQIEFEQDVASKMDKILVIIQAPPYDTDALDSLSASLARRTFVVNDPVFEDLKSSGNLAVISNLELRNELLQVYNELNRVEAVIARNNEMWVDRTTEFMLGSGLADFGHPRKIQVSNLPEVSLHTSPFPGASQITREQLSNELLRFTLHNKLSWRVLVSNVHVTLMEELRDESHEMIQQISMQLEQLQ